jgi:endonuclease YncB( thermonuclease family)
MPSGALMQIAFPTASLKVLSFRNNLSGMKRLLVAPVLVFLLTLAGPCWSAEPHSLEVRVVGITDGDTITVVDSNQLQHRIRLTGIDAPEKGQPFSARSRQALSDLVYRRTVTIQWSKADRYGRFLAKVLVSPPGDCPTPCTARLDVNLAQVDTGLAWHYKEYEKEQSPSDRKAYAAAEQRARALHIGIWSQPDPVAPWDQRHGTAGGKVKKSGIDTSR